MRHALILALPDKPAVALTAARITRPGGEPGIMVHDKRRYHAYRVVQGAEDKPTVDVFRVGALPGTYALWLLQPDDDGQEPARALYTELAKPVIGKLHAGPWTPDVFRKLVSTEVWQAVLGSWVVIWGSDTVDEQVLQDDKSLTAAAEVITP